MAIFVALGRSTDEGLKHLGGFAQRHEQAVKRAESLGGKVLTSYALMGEYDFRVILECLDATTALKILVKEAEGGNVRYQTLTAIPVEEFSAII